MGEGRMMPDVDRCDQVEVRSNGGLCVDILYGWSQI